MIFAREISDRLTSLVKKIDSATAANESKSMGSFVVFLSDEEGLAEKLKTLAAKQGFKHIVLAMDSPAGPAGYDVAKEAAVTVVLYNNRRVEANHAFRKGALNDKGIEAILADLPKILTD